MVNSAWGSKAAHSACYFHIVDSGGNYWYTEHPGSFGTLLCSTTCRCLKFYVITYQDVHKLFISPSYYLSQDLVFPLFLFTPSSFSVTLAKASIRARPINFLLGRIFFCCGRSLIKGKSIHRTERGNTAQAKNMCKLGFHSGHAI